MKRIGLIVMLLVALLMILPAEASARRFRHSHRFHHFPHRSFFGFGFGVPLIYAPDYYYVPPPGYYAPPPEYYAPPSGPSAPPPGAYETPAGRWEWRCDPPGGFCQWMWVPAY